MLRTVLPHRGQARRAPRRALQLSIRPASPRPSRRVAPVPFVDVPSGEAGERLRRLLLALGHRLAIAAVLAERAEALEDRAAPRMAQDVARLEISAILGLLEREVLGKRLFRVADMEPRQHDRLRARAAPAAVIGDPGDA